MTPLQASGGTTSRGTRTAKLRSEWRLFRRDGLVKYLRLLYRLRRFHRAVDRMHEEGDSRA